MYIIHLYVELEYTEHIYVDVYTYVSVSVFMLPDSVMQEIRL